jgi:PTS system galactitol-specific IIC component
MEAIKAIYDFITGFGPSVMMPIIVTLLALILGASFGKALRAGITVGIGFIGINLVIGLLFQYLGPAAEGMVKNWGVSLTAIDVGWPVAAAIAFGTDIGRVIFIVGLLVNIIMLVARLTKTVDIDLWNYWHWAFSGSLVYVVTGNFLLGIVAAIIHAAASLIIADMTAPRIKEYFHWPDISIPQGFATASMLLVWPIIWLFDRIGFQKEKVVAEGEEEARRDVDVSAVRQRFAFFGEPVLVGLVLGLVIGILAYAPAGLTFQTLLTNILQLAMATAAVMLLLPRVVGILMEGLVPLSEQAREFLQKRFAGRDFYIGMDSALLIGEPTTLAVGFILVPITLLLAVILPGNRMLPFGDLAATPFFIAMLTPYARGNFWRTLVGGTIIMIVLMYMGSIWTPVITATAQSIGYAFPEGAAQITGFANPIAWILTMISQLLFGK